MGFFSELLRGLFGGPLVQSATANFDLGSELVEVSIPSQQAPTVEKFVVKISPLAPPYEMRRCKPGAPLVVSQTNDGSMTIENPEGSLLGKIGAKNKVSQLVSSGKKIIHAEVCSVQDGEKTTISARLFVGNLNDRFVEPKIENRTAIYPVGLVGESNYQASIRRCREGEQVRLFREPNNKFDPEAIVALSVRGEVIGYIPRENWLHRAVHGQGEGALARIKSINGAGRKSLGVVIDIKLAEGPMPAR